MRCGWRSIRWACAPTSIRRWRVALDVVKRSEVRQRPSCDLTAVIGVQIEELAPCVDGTSDFDDAVLKAGLVPAIVVAHQLAPPATQECAGMLTRTTDGETVDHGAQLTEVHGRIRPQIPPVPSPCRN
ncbi:hypothetical protein PCAR4_1210012 [Paraburkholderia caribensis]|nr:hypothetical protein PCAR4_1210012 [Paraburkholderia caribensis]